MWVVAYGMRWDGCYYMDVFFCCDWELLQCPSVMVDYENGTLNMIFSV